MSERRSMQVEGFTCVVRDFDTRIDTPMLTHTLVINHKRNLTASLRNNEKFIRFVRAKFVDILKHAHRIRVLCIEGSEESILGFAVYLFAGSDKPFETWVNRKLGEHRDEALDLMVQP